MPVMRTSSNRFITMSKVIKNTIHYNDLQGNYSSVDTMMQTGVIKISTNGTYFLNQKPAIHTLLKWKFVVHLYIEEHNLLKG